MKKIITLIALAISTMELQAQKLEVAVQADGNLSHYTSKYDYDDAYGKNNRAGFDLGIKAQTVFKSGFLLGLQAGYEVLKSKSDYSPAFPVYDTFSPVAGPSAIDYVGGFLGHTYTVNKFLDLSPYVGYRLSLGVASIDFMPGVDIGIKLSTQERALYKYSGSDTYYSFAFKPDVADLDVRLKGNVSVNIQRWSINGGYAYGLTSYLKNTDDKVHSRIVRLGLAYRIF